MELVRAWSLTFFAAVISSKRMMIEVGSKMSFETGSARQEA